MADALTDENGARADVDRLLEAGEYFLTVDLTRELIDRFPAAAWPRHYAARALIRLGAVHESREVLRPLLQRGAHADDAETQGLAARVQKAIWQSTGRTEDLRLARDEYADAADRAGSLWATLNAATLSVVLGRCLVEAGQRSLAVTELERGRDLAAKTVVLAGHATAGESRRDTFWRRASLGEARLLLGNEAAATAAYAEAFTIDPSRTAAVSVFDQLDLLQAHGVPVPAAVWQMRHVSSVVVFTGHMLDRPGQNRFPAALVPTVARAIDAAVDELKPDVAYVSAACGADLLFAEAVLRRGAELHVVLPFDEADFLSSSVAWAGPEWVRRYRAVRDAVGARLHHATREGHLGTDTLFDFANRMMHGAAVIAAHTARTRPKLLAVIEDGEPRVGGASAFVRDWPDPANIRLIRLSDLKHDDADAATDIAPPFAPAAPTSVTTHVHHDIPRSIKAMMFADIVGYSRLDEQAVPWFLFDFLRQVAKSLEQVTPQPLMLNTWGDAIFAAGGTAASLVQYALALRNAVGQTDWRAVSLPGNLQVRIGLHAGPVFESIDPITGRPNYFGSHVIRAARIEPITIPDHIYASEQFVALLLGELGSVEACRGFTLEYLGAQALAKNFGKQPIYHVRATDD